MQPSTRRYDVIVSGAGPAGATAARLCASAGLNTLLVDQASFPRPKACGGGIPAIVGNIPGLGLDVEQLAGHRVRQQLLRLRGEREQQIHLAKPIYMVEREHFDTALVEAAVASGARLREGVQITEIAQDAGHVCLRSRQGDRLEARYLLGADGASGPTSRYLNNQRERPPATALDLELKVEAPHWDTWRERCLFDFGVVPGGYAWVFPKAQTLSCGIGAWRGARGLKRALYHFADSLFGGEYTVVAERAHRIPLFEPATELARGRVLALGDAANLVDPILGEGIRFAIWSATLAATSLAEGGEVAEHYSESVKAAFVDEFAMLRHLAHTDFVEAPEFFYNAYFEKGRDYRPVYRALSQLSGAAPGSIVKDTPGPGEKST